MVKINSESLKGALKQKSNLPAYFFEFQTRFQYSNLIGQLNITAKAWPVC